MKAIFIFYCLLYFGTAYSQQVVDLKQIDSIVTTINYSKSKSSQDSVIQNHPELGLFLKSYLTMVVENSQVVKYVNYVKTERVENGVTKQMHSCNTFYYNQSKLIKVEEFMLADNQVQQIFWYFSNDKCLYYNIKTERAELRANQLLDMSKELLNRVSEK